MTESSTARLFEPVTLGDLTLANRIVMAPLTRARSSDDGVPPTFAADYYAQRASAGLIVSEATNISPQARAMPSRRASGAMPRWTPGGA